MLTVEPLWHGGRPLRQNFPADGGHVRVPVEQALDRRNPLRIDLVVIVREGDDRSPRGPDSCVASVRDALTRFENAPQRQLILTDEPLQEGAGFVPGIVVDNDDFAVKARWQLLPSQASYGAREGLGPIVRADHDGDAGNAVHRTTNAMKVPPFWLNSFLRWPIAPGGPASFAVPAPPDGRSRAQRSDGREPRARKSSCALSR